MKADKKVIDCDRMVIIGYFNESDTKATIDKYESQGVWEEVLTDRDGDLCLYRPDEDE